MKTKSAWGNPPTRLYKFRDIINSKFGNNASVCIIGASDGKFVMPFLRSGMQVVAYDLDDSAINGGMKEFPIERDDIVAAEYTPNPDRNPIYVRVPSEEREILGLKKRVEIEKLTANLSIVIDNFYKNPPKKTFDAVFTSCSIPYPCNFDMSISHIINVIQKSVTPGGYVYMDYMMPLEDCHTWRPKHYLRRGEIKKYFDNTEWKLISLYEMKKPVFEAAHVDRPEDHFHRFGYILAEHLKNNNS